MVLETIRSLQQEGRTGGQVGRFKKPGFLAGGEISQRLEPIERLQRSGGVPLKVEHGQGLVQRQQQTCVAQIIGADKSITVSVEHPDARTHPEGWTDAGDRVVFCKNADVIGALEEYLNEVCRGFAPLCQQRLQPLTPSGLTRVETHVLSLPWMGCNQTARLRQALIMEN